MITPLGKKRDLGWNVAEFLEKERSALEVLAELFERLPLLDSPLGKLASELQKHDVPPGAERPKTRADDLFPLDIHEVGIYLSEKRQRSVL